MNSVVPITHTFYGLVEFETPIECTKEALGSKADVVIGGIAGVLELPSAADWGMERPEDPLSTPLTPPADAATWKRGDEPIGWGRVVHYPKGTTKVEKALLTFKIPDDHLRTQATSVYKGFSRWHKLFNQYLELSTKQRRFSMVEYTEKPVTLDLFRWGTNGAPDRPYEKDPSHVTIYMSDDDTLLKPGQFFEICKLASSSQEPQLQYQIQLEAYRAMRNGDYREAIIETGIAAELGLLRASQEIMSKTGITFAEELVKKFQALGGKLQLARMVGVKLPEIDFQKRLVEPRNSVIHRGFFADRAVAEDAIKVTDELLNNICPSLQEVSENGLR